MGWGSTQEPGSGKLAEKVWGGGAEKRTVWLADVLTAPLA